MRISSITKNSYANGPGRRNVLHVQGCGLACPGCFNKHTWAKKGGRETTVSEVATELLADTPDGITISGGEPMEQWEDVQNLIKEMLVVRPTLSVIIFTGWTKNRLEKSGYLDDMRDSYYLNETLVSMLVSGPYVEKLACSDRPLISSSNQEIIYVNPAYEQVDLNTIPRVEVSCGPDGTIQISGLPDSSTLGAIKEG